ncbi:MAG: tRNA-binding protein [Acetobacteraceae bacterium]|nr:tRNA-binding protein [Acetobacteraceae bacterium]
MPRGGVVHEEVSLVTDAQVLPLRELATIDEFERIDVRVGRITAVDDFPAARKPAYRLTLDFGPLGSRQSSAQLTGLYSREDLLGRLIMAVVNFPARRIAGFASEVLVLGVPDVEGNVILVEPEREVPLGVRMF